MNDLWDDLKAPVREAGWGNQLNTFPELSVAFWRWAIWKLFESDGAPRRGVVAYISNRTFLAGKPYAGLRAMLRERFDRIEIIDLRGDVRRGERAGVEHDQGVFNIQVGTAITLAIADGTNASGALASVTYIDSWAEGITLRDEKLAWLQDGSETRIAAESVAVDRGLLDDMKPEAFQNGGWPSIAQCFAYSSSGLESKRDHIVYDFDRQSLLRKLRGLRQHNPDTLDEYFNSTSMNPALTAIRQPVDENLVSLAGTGRWIGDGTTGVRSLTTGFAPDSRMFGEPKIFASFQCQMGRTQDPQRGVSDSTPTGTPFAAATAVTPSRYVTIAPVTARSMSRRACSSGSPRTTALR
jgi:hypothetical protein